MPRRPGIRGGPDTHGMPGDDGASGVCCNSQWVGGGRDHRRGRCAGQFAALTRRPSSTNSQRHDLMKQTRAFRNATPSSYSLPKRCRSPGPTYQASPRQSPPTTLVSSSSCAATGSHRCISKLYLAGGFANYLNGITRSQSFIANVPQTAYTRVGNAA